MFPLGLSEIDQRKAISWNTLAKKICPGIDKGEEITLDYLKELSERAEEYIADTNNIIDIINEETKKKGETFKAKEGILTLLLLSNQYHKEKVSKKIEKKVD
jgi:hypothetical protein